MKPSDPAGQLRVNVLGGVELVVDGDVVPFSSPRLRHLLAVLVANADSVVSAERLVDIIWPDDDERQAIRTLRTNVWRLRNLMGAAADKALLTRPGGYVIDTRECVIDADRFEAIAEDATARLGAGDAPGAVEQFDAALALWRGEPYASLPDEDWARPVAVRLMSLREAAREHRIEALLASGRSNEAIADLAEMITRDPFRERLQAMYMKALYRDRRQAEALRAYASYRSALGEELGVEPSAELRLLEQSMLSGDPVAIGSTALPITRGYELFGAVDATPATVTYRARGPRAAIDVMVTIVDRSIAGDVGFARAFEVGAQRMCGVAHPAVVPVVDCWRDVDGAYFVWPADRWGERHPGHVPDEARFLRVVDQVCSALHHLHLHGLHHGALGSESIRVVADGDVVITPGGLALGLHRGSTQRDLHDLAAWLGTIVPLDAASAVDAALSRARADRGDDRFESVAEFADAVFAATTGSGAPAAAAIRNPFLGLRPFDEADADVFFGRGRLVKAVLDRLAEPDVRGRFVAVVGASGSGKSSLVQAGVVPALRDGGTAGSADWFVARMAPGDHPFAACRAALDAVAIRPAHGANDSADADVVRRAHESLPPGSTLLLVIDQLEELFSSRVDATERRDFLDMVTSAITDPAAAVRVITTMRADFYDRPLQHPRFGRLFHQCQVVVTTLVDDEVAEAIMGPADVVGLELEAGLVRSLVRDFDTNPSLPLLQHALAELFDRRAATVATLEAYDSIGGLAGGIAHRAEALYATFPAAAQGHVRRLLTHLVALGDGTADTRRRVERRELDDPADGASTVDSIIERFGAARLLTFDHDRLTRQPTVEIAHDALIAEWGRLAAWVDEDRADLVLARQVAAAVRSWIDGGRDDSDLFRGLRLDAAISWSERRPGAVSPDTSAFLDAGSALVQREAEEQRDRAEHRRRQQRRLVRLAGAATVAAVLAVTAGGVATIQSRRADDARAVAEDARAIAEVARDRSEVDRLVAQAIADAEDSPARSMLLAAAAYDLAPSVETAGAMQSAIVSRPRGFVGFIPSGGETAQVEVGATVIVRHTSDEVEIIDRMDRDVRLVIPDPTDNTRFALSADDRWLALAGPTIRVFDAASGSLIAELARSPRSTVLAFDPTAPSRLAIGFDDGSAEVVQWASDEVETRMAAQRDQVVALVFSPDGRRLATSTGERESAVRVWDPRTGDAITDNLGIAGTALYHRDLSFDSTGRLLASVDRGGVGRVWSIPDGEPITQTEITYGVEALNAVEFIDATSLVASGPSGVLRFWSAVDGKELETVEPHAGLVTSLAVDPLRRMLVVGGNDQLSLFDLGGISPGRDIDPFPDEMREALGTGGPVNASISADGGVLAAVTPSGVWLWHRGGADEGARVLPPSGAAGILLGATLSPDGSLVAVSHLDLVRGRTEIVVVDTASSNVIETIDAPRGAIVALSPDNRWIAYSSISFPRTPTLDLRDLETGRTISLVDDLEAATSDVDPIRGSWVSSLSFSADSRRFAAANHRGAAMIWRLSDTEAIGEPLADGGGGAILDLEFAPSGDDIVTVSSSGALSIIGADDRAPTAPLTSGRSGLTLGLALSPDGTLLLSGGSDGISLWDRATGRALGLPYPVSTFVTPPMHWAQDSRSFSVVTPQGVETWTVDPGVWRTALCELAGRSLTDEEWRSFGSAGPTPSC